MKIASNSYNPEFSAISAKKLNFAEKDKIYEQAENYVEKIPKERINEVVKEVFRPKGETDNTYYSCLKFLKQSADELAVPQEVKDIILKISDSAKSIIDKAEGFSTESRKKLDDECITFNEKYKTDYNNLIEYFNKTPENAEQERIYKRVLYALKVLSEYGIVINFNRISELPKEVLPSNGIFYHGTKKPRLIARNGFSTYYSNQVNCRELGVGVYTTPDKSVAANFAGLRGRIIPLEANIHNTAFVDNDSFQWMTYKSDQLAEDMGIDIKSNTPFNVAVRELLINKLFAKAGYDSVYTNNSLASGMDSADKLIGKPQSQLVIFNPKNITLCAKKPLKEKIKDELLQIKAFFTLQTNGFKTSFDNVRKQQAMKKLGFN